MSEAMGKTYPLDLSGNRPSSNPSRIKKQARGRENEVLRNPSIIYYYYPYHPKQPKFGPSRSEPCKSLPFLLHRFLVAPFEAVQDSRILARILRRARKFRVISPSQHQSPHMLPPSPAHPRWIESGAALRE